MVSNNSDAVQCAACETPKPGAEPQQAEDAEDEKKKPAFGFSFGTSKTKKEDTAPHSFNFKVVVSGCTRLFSRHPRQTVRRNQPAAASLLV